MDQVAIQPTPPRRPGTLDGVLSWLTPLALIVLVIAAAWFLSKKRVK